MKAKTTGRTILMLPYPLTNFEMQNIIQTKLNLLVFIQGIIYLK